MRLGFFLHSLAKNSSQGLWDRGRCALELQNKEWRKTKMKTRALLSICAAGALCTTLWMGGCSSSDSGPRKLDSSIDTGTGSGGNKGTGGTGPVGTGGSTTKRDAAPAPDGPNRPDAAVKQDAPAPRPDAPPPKEDAPAPKLDAPAPRPDAPAPKEDASTSEAGRRSDVEPREAGTRPDVEPREAGTRPDAEPREAGTRPDSPERDVPERG
jgi:hypothetical protein